MRIPFRIITLYSESHYSILCIVADQNREQLVDHHSSPVNPEALNRDELFPAYAGSNKPVEVADIGCGFGGLLFALGPHFPDMLMMGKFIRFST